MTAADHPAPPAPAAGEALSLDQFASRLEDAADALAGERPIRLGLQRRKR